jgi:hypothetical protein
VAHLRSQIFAAVVAELKLIPEFAAASKVARGRTRAIPQEALPAITVTWADDDERAMIRPCAAPDGSDGYDRDLPISLIVHLRDADPEEEFDRICVLVETRMAGIIKAGGLAIEMTLASSRFFVNRETGLPLMAGRLVYRASYKTRSDPALAAI